MLKEYVDDQLIELIRESSEEANDLLYNKYKYIVDVNKYYRIGKLLGYEYNDLYLDGLTAFSDALVTYRRDKENSLASFITLCVNRKIRASLTKANNPSNKILCDYLCLDHQYENLHAPLDELLQNDDNEDLLQTLVNGEDLSSLMNKMKTFLSDKEYEVCSLLAEGFKYNEIALFLNKSPKQIDNTIQRIRNKLKSILNEDII